METKIYEKYQKAKTIFHAQPLKKSGLNAFSKFQYFELGDILPAIIKACNETKTTTIINFDENFATLKFIDTETADEIVFNSPLASCTVKGCNEIQNLGAMQTYIRRYLYVMAFDVIENDILDANAGSEEKKQEPKKENVQVNPKFEQKIDCLTQDDCKKFMIKMQESGVSNEKIISVLKAYNWNRLSEVQIGLYDQFVEDCLNDDFGKV